MTGQRSIAVLEGGPLDGHEQPVMVITDLITVPWRQEQLWQLCYRHRSCSPQCRAYRHIYVFDGQYEAA